MDNILANKNGKARGLAIGTSIALGVVMLPTVAAETQILAEDDWVGISFWIATAMMLASTVFFLVERQNVDDKWKTFPDGGRSGHWCGMVPYTTCVRSQ
ncbi:MAG: hypothetical protein Ct9H90mP24_3970 [Methanobacteriota archaeon]|nr:MAG: hypothetical protein Ct9H90mP24_3970 [Euryarchaeota archaeon]